VITDWRRSVKNRSDFYPGVYPERRRRGGEPFDVAQGRELVERRVTTSSVTNNYKFTGLQRDPESGLDHTLFRQYSSILGRWLTPDLWDGDINNPQSLNRYAYVLNNPTTLADPLGLDEGSGPPLCVFEPRTGTFYCGPGFSGGGGTPGGPCSLIRYAFAHPMVSNCPPRGGGGGGVRFSFSKSKYDQCCQDAFGKKGGLVPGWDKTILSYAMALAVAWASASTGGGWRSSPQRGAEHRKVISRQPAAKAMRLPSRAP
jgi:RHS repeat-associated protein